MRRTSWLPYASLLCPRNLWPNLEGNQTQIGLLNWRELSGITQPELIFGDLSRGDEVKEALCKINCQNSRYGEYKRLTCQMGPLAEVYLEAKYHGHEGIILPHFPEGPEGIRLLACPCDRETPLYKEDGKLNEGFFVKWHKNIENNFNIDSRILCVIEIIPNNRELLTQAAQEGKFDSDVIQTYINNIVR